MAGVNHSENGEEIVFFSEVPDLDLVALPHSCDILVGEAHLLCSFQDFEVERMSLEGLFHIDNSLYSLEEEGGNLCDFVNLIDCCAAVENLGDGEDIVIAELFYIVEDFLC